MLPKNPSSKKHYYVHRIKELFKCYPKNTTKSHLLSEKIATELSLIPELMTFIGGENISEIKVILNEVSSLLQIKECIQGHFFQRILSDNFGNNFIMILKGSIMELGIKYVKKNITFREYILFLTKIYLLKEKYLYWDCIKKNNDSFPLKYFKNYIESFDTKNKNSENVEDEKNNFEINNIKDVEDIDIINIGKEINMKDFDFLEEMQRLKKEISNSNWKKYKRKYNIPSEINYDEVINSFFELYNYKENNINNINDTKSSSLKDAKYSIYLPYFFNKRILKPVSFIGDLNSPFQMKNYTTFITLDNCFITYIDKYRLDPASFLFKFSHKQRLNYIHEKIFSKHYIFKHINMDYLNNYGKYFQILYLNKNDVIFIQGEVNKGVFIITNGSIQLMTNQSYINLINLNYSLLHSLDYCKQYISDIKKKEIYTHRNQLNGYYDYNTKLNILMNNPTFAKNSKIYENINFGTYEIRDVLGLGEMFNYKNNINLFTAKAACDNTEVVFIPREIFQALLSNDIINQKCGSITEEKTRALRDCISRYKNFFENKISRLVNKKNNNGNNNLYKNIASKSLLLKNKNQIFKNFMDNFDKIKKIKYDFNIKKNNNNEKISDNEKSNIISRERNNLSFKEKSPTKVKKNSDYFSLRKNLISTKLYKNNKNLLNRNNFKRTLMELSSKYPPNLSQRSNFSDLNFKSERVNNYLTKLKNEKVENINLRCESAKRLRDKKTFKNRNIFLKNKILSKSTNHIDIDKTLLDKKMIIQKFNKLNAMSFLGNNRKGNTIEQEKL